MSVKRIVLRTLSPAPRWTASGEELLDFVDHAVDVSDGEAVVLAWNFDKPGAGYAAGDLASSFGGDDRIPAVDDQGWRADRGQDVPMSRLEEHPRDGGRDRGAR